MILRKAAAEVVAVRPTEVRVCGRGACVSIGQHAAEVVAVRPTLVRICRRGWRATAFRKSLPCVCGRDRGRICGRGAGARVCGIYQVDLVFARQIDPQRYAAEVCGRGMRQRWGRRGGARGFPYGARGAPR